MALEHDGDAEGGVAMGENVTLVWWYVLRNTVAVEDCHRSSSARVQVQQLVARHVFGP